MTSMLAMTGGILAAVPALCFIYAYAGYPAILWLATRGHGADRGVCTGDDFHWPEISITLPAFNEADSIARTLDRILALDYPVERRQIVVVSDASTDATDEIVRGYSDRGVELVRVSVRRGKTAAEAAAMPHLTGDIVVNTDATIAIPANSLKPLVRAFADSSVGVASGRDISARSLADESNRSESGYVGYEMWVRSLETRCGTIVGASGCFYAIRRQLHRPEYPEALSRDFASCLIARKNGFRSVSVDQAVCYVPRAASLDSEYRRKVRTMARGLSTLWHERSLLNPLRYGRFAWMLASHKLTRWLVWLTWPAGLAGMLMLTLACPSMWPFLALVLAFLALGWLGWKGPLGGRVGVIAPAAYAVASATAGLRAWVQAIRGRQHAIWEPTRR